MGDNVPFVSVVCLCYNHEQYIRETLDSILMQKTNFAFEIIIHDDASTDNSAEIIMEYYNRYPEIIVPILQSENQYSRNIDINSQYIYPKVRGKYIALCECDDYWIDRFKLQYQIDYMEKYNECSCCIHAAYKFDDKNKKCVGQMILSESDKNFFIEDAISGLGSKAATNSFIYRTKYLGRITEVKNHLTKTGVDDYVLLIILSNIGYIHYINKVMSIYRINVKNSWTSRSKNSVNKHIEYLKKDINMIQDLYNVLPSNVYVYLRNEIDRDEFKILLLKGLLFQAKFKYPSLYDDVSIFEKIKVIFRYIILKIDKNGVLYNWICKLYRIAWDIVYGKVK